MRGLMMERPLLISDLLEHAAAVHGDPEIVSGTDYDQVAVAWQFRWALGFSRNQAPIGTLGELMTNFPSEDRASYRNTASPINAIEQWVGRWWLSCGAAAIAMSALAVPCGAGRKAHLGRKRLVVPAVFAIVDGEAHVGG